MKSVILAAGRGTRMQHLTDEVPKPMLEVAGKTLLEHKIDMFPDEIDEVVLVTGYHENAIRSHFGDEYSGLPITYVSQDRLNGTGGALHAAREHLRDDRFLVMMGDDIYCREDMEAVIQHDWAMGVAALPYLERGGRVMLDEAGDLADIQEGTHQVKHAMVNIGLFSLSPEIFSYELVKLDGKDEYGLPQTLIRAVHDGHRIKLVESHFWMQMTSPEDIEKAEAFFKPESSF